MKKIQKLTKMEQYNRRMFTVEKNYTKIRNFALILIIILITIIAFIGIYVKKLNAYKDFIPEYKTGMDFDGYAELKFKLSEESEEKEVWLDSDGKFKGYVVSQDQQSEGDAVVETQGPQSVSEEAEQVSIYKKEKRTIKDNEDSVLNKECYNRTKVRRRQAHCFILQRRNGITLPHLPQRISSRSLSISYRSFHGFRRVFTARHLSCIVSS